MIQDLILIKLGGSVITDKKSQKPKLNQPAIKNLIKQIKKISLSNRYRLIIIHGAGSFGHPLAKKYKLTGKIINDQQKLGFSKTIHAMQELNNSIWTTFLKNQIPVANFPPHSLGTNLDEVIDEKNIRTIETFLESNFVVMLFGDMILSKKNECFVLSGDRIVSLLAKRLKATKVIFVSDVNGIYTDDPQKNPTAQPIPVVNDKNLFQIKEYLKNNNKYDVTGGMLGKILTIHNELKSTPVDIINGLKKDSLLKLVSGKKIGTELFFK